MANRTPVIPETVTVHLGAPDSRAENVTVSFPDYIKNVASSEIYPTWPENAIRANMYAQISFALNRIYTEYYRSRGYDFDITNSTAYDQYFVKDRAIFENIDRIADEIFDSYLVRGNAVEPFFAQYCNGTTVTCDGLSQWGTVPLARDGLYPYQILQYYYGDDIRIVSDAPIANVRQSYPGVPLELGSIGDDVRNLQLRLNRISKNYPAIPKIYPVDGIFAAETEEAVRAFQRIFNLSPDGIVGRATWYAVLRIFAAVKRLSELNSESLRLEDISSAFPDVLERGMQSRGVQNLQYMLAYIAQYVNTVPPIPITGYFGTQTEDAVRAFQETYGLTPDGIVGAATWDAVYDVYRGIIESLPPSAFENTVVPFPGRYLVRGSEGEDVRLLQEYINVIADSGQEGISALPVTGYFGSATYNAVTALQRRYGIDANGVVGPLTWEEIASEANDITEGNRRSTRQYSGNYMR